MSRALRRYSARIQHSMGDVTKLTEQSLHGHRVVKVFDGQEQERQQFKEVNARNFRLHTRLVAVQALGDGLTQYAVALGVAAVMYFSFSDLDESSFLGFITAMGMVLAPLKRLININAVVQRGIAAASSLFEILDQPGEPDTGTKTIERARGEVAYRNVSFRYDPGKDPCAARREPRRAGRDDRRARRPVGQRQIDVGRACCRGSTTRRGRRAARRRRRAQLHAARPTAADRAREPGHRAVRRHDCQQHRVRRARASIRAPTSSAPRKPRTSRSSPRRCRKASTRESASGARCSRAGSGNASRSRARC